MAFRVVIIGGTGLSFFVCPAAVAWRLRPCAMHEATPAADARNATQERPC